MKRLSLPIFLIIFLFANLQIISAKNASSSATAEPVKYDLPYPGILPDNPLYYLKAIRDNVLNIFITDPVKKTNYDLLMADKRLGSAKILLDEGKNNLAITTLSKAGNYFFLALRYADDAKKQGGDINPTVDKLITAAKKHQEVIAQMIEKSQGKTKESLISLEKRTAEFEKSAVLLKSK